MIKFSIKIDDQGHSLSKENGIAINEIGPLLENLFNAIDTGKGYKITLGQIRGNCYALDFYTEDEGYLTNFITVHKNIEQLPIDELQPEERKYATNLKLILGEKYYLKAYDNESVEIAAIAEIGTKELPSFYYTTDTVYGIVSELGSGTNLFAKKKHIYVDSVPYKIFISKDQDLHLKLYYGTHKLRIELKQRRSLIDGHIVNSELESFVVIEQGNLSDNLSKEGYVDFELIKDTNTIEDILNRIYAVRQ